MLVETLPLVMGIGILGSRNQIGARDVIETVRRIFEGVTVRGTFLDDSVCMDQRR